VIASIDANILLEVLGPEPDERDPPRA